MAWLHFLPLVGRLEKDTTGEGKKAVKKQVSFEDLAKLAQVSRDPCGKQAFSMSGARNAARDRNEFTTGKTYYPTVCFEGCGRNIFHLTTLPPTGRVRAMFEKGPTRANLAKRERWKRARARERAQVCVWEGEGGSYRE